MLEYIIILSIIIMPIIVRLICLYLYEDERKNEDGFLLTIYEAFRELLNGKHEK